MFLSAELHRLEVMEEWVAKDPTTGCWIWLGYLTRGGYAQAGSRTICLYTMDYREGNVMYVHAYFRNEDEAKRFIETVNRFFGFESNTNEENQ